MNRQYIPFIKLKHGNMELYMEGNYNEPAVMPIFATLK